MKEILYPWKSFIKESLTKDIERYQLATDLYNFIFERVSKVTKSGVGDYVYEYYETSIDIITEPGDNGKITWLGNQVVVGFMNLPKHIQELFFGKELPKEKQNEDEEEPVAKVASGVLIINLLSYTSEEGVGGLYTMPKLNKSGHFKPEIWVYGCKISSLKSIKKETLEILKAKKGTIIHEIAHLIDDISLMGHKSFRHKTEKSEEEKEKYFKKGYYNIGLEINARWVEILNWLNGRQYSDYKNPDNDMAERFEYWLGFAKRIMHFSKMAPAKQRKFISRLYEFYENGPYKAPDNIIDFEVKRLVDQHKKYMDSVLLYAEMDKITYREFYNRLWWSEDNVYTEELGKNKVIMRYFYPLGRSPYPYSPENSKIIVNKAEDILMPLIEKFAAKHKDKFKGAK